MKPFESLDFEKAVLMGNKMHGAVLKVKRTTDKIIFPAVDGSIHPFYFDEMPYPVCRSLEYRRLTNTHIFYCPD